MSKLFGQNDPRIVEYFEKEFAVHDPVLDEIRDRAGRAGLPNIHVAVTDGLHLEVLTRAFGAKKVVEIGTLAGYSGVCILRALPKDGKLYTFEFETAHADVARETFKKAGASDRVELRVGAAIEKLPEIEKQGPFDLVFIDADKTSYPAYFEWAAKNLRSGGAILADNTFAWNQITDTTFEDDETRDAIFALREFNRLAAHDPRFRSTILPTGEGLTLAVKK